MRLALEQADGSVFRFDTRVLPDGASAGRRQRHVPRALRQVPALVARRLAHLRRWAGDARRTAGRALPRHRHRALRRAPGWRADVRSSARGRAHARPACRALRDQAARPASRRLPDRLRSRRQRSQGRGGDRRHAWSSATRPSGIRTTSPIRNITSTGSWTRCRRPPRTCRASMPSAAAPPASTSTTGSRRVAVPRRAGGRVRRAREGPVPRDPESLERRAVRGRQRWRGDGARRLDVARGERHSRHRARHQHRRPATSRPTATSPRGSNELAFVPDRLQSRRGRSTSGRATTAWALSISRSSASAG